MFILIFYNSGGHDVMGVIAATPVWLSAACHSHGHVTLTNGHGDSDN